MICMYRHRGETYILKDNDGQDVRLSVFEPTNFPLIVDASLDDAQPWYVCSPNVLSTEILHRAHNGLNLCREAFKTSLEKGGPRRLSEFDKACCRLRLKVSDDDSLFGVSGDDMAEIVETHPAFFGGLCFMCADVVCAPLINTLNAIYDIRRFVSRGAGRTRNKLRSYFRLTNPEALLKAKRKMDQREPLTPPEIRLLSLVYSWQTPSESFSRNILPALPHMFLMREWDEYSSMFEEQGVDEDTAIDLGVFRTTLRALEFLHLTWMSGLGDLEFDPYRFFKRREEAEAFLDYLTLIS